MTLTARLTAAEQRLNGLNLARLFRSPLADLAVGAGLTLLALLPALTSGVLEKDGMRAAAVVAFLVLATLPQAIRHRHPVATVALTFIGALGLLLYGVAPYDMGIGVHLSGFLSYLTLVRLLPRGTAWFLTAALATGLTVLGFLSGSLFWIVCALGAGGATLLMELSRSRGEVREVRQENLEALREQAAMAERTRIAREMHDIVAHSISTIVVRAEAAPYTVADVSDGARRAFEEIAATARDTLAEMRRLLGVLRTEGTTAETAPQPGLDRLPELLAEHRSGGGKAELDVIGQVRRLPPTVDLAAYRIVQEALTNARTHAPGALVRLEIAYLDEEVTLRIADDGPGDSAGGASGGHGLAGMRERVLMLGGWLRTGTAPEGGFLIEAGLPG